MNIGEEIINEIPITDREFWPNEINATFLWDQIVTAYYISS